MMRAFSLFWMLTVIAILIAGKWWQPAHDFRDRMLRQWKPSLVIALLHAVGAGIGGMRFFQLSSIAKFCQAMIGLALAYSILGYEPLPVTQALIHKERRTESIARMLGAAMAVVIAAIFVN